jgi:endothelin-converting enzyme/putative endopeptidase
MITALALSLSLFAAAAEPAQPASLGFSTASLDTTADPCGDFYQYACGGWLKANEIPADQSRWSRFQELGERNKVILRGILEKRMSADPKRDAVDQKIGDFYASCMDEDSIEKKGAEPLREQLSKIEGLTRADLPATLARLQRSGVSAALSFGSGQDLKDATRVIAQADQGGLGLPDRDYYFKGDPKSVALRDAYQKHIAKMFELSGRNKVQADNDAAVVMQFEVALASASQDRVFRRDPKNLDHKMTRADLAKAAPGFDWDRYFDETGAPKFGALNVGNPEFLKALANMTNTVALSSWKDYLAWHAIHDNAALLPKAFVDEDFAFYGKTLTGAQELKPRWKRCVEMTDGLLGEALGKRYVEDTFGAEGKKRTHAMVLALEKALGRDIKGVDWMTPATKKAAEKKLQAIANKIGYPDKWRDYSSVTILRGDALGNAVRAEQFEWQRRLDKIGKPVDRTEWDMTPPTVNAYYDPQMNNINFPAGILQPPFYDNNMDDAVNFGGIGAVIGHELTHGFDDEGRQFDAQGNLKEWWTAKDAKAFEKRAQCLVDEYSGFTAVDDVKLNGKLTLGENTADNGGLRIAHMALMDTLKNKKVQPIDGYTPQQRLFLGWGQVWCMKIKDEAARMRAMTDPHSPGQWRVNGVVRNMPEFAKAFSCKPGAPMAPQAACRVW